MRPARLLPFLVVAFLAAAPLALATNPPHDATKLTQGCVDCHVLHSAPNPRLIGTVCVDCHTARGFTLWQPTDQAVPGTSGSSHSWSGIARNPTYGAALPTDAGMLSKISGGALGCIVCHDPHTQAKAPADPRAPSTAGSAGRHFQRVANVSNQMCADCHASWNMTSTASSTFVTSGTATFTSGGTAVSGTGTSWSTQLQPGWQIKRDADPATAFTVIQSVDSNTALTLAVGYKGTGGTGTYAAGKTMSHPVGLALPNGGLTVSPPREVGGSNQDPGYVGTASTGSTTSLTDSTKAWATNALANRWVRLFDAPNAGLVRQITTNTATQINWTTAVTGNVAAGNKYQIDLDGNTSNNVVLDNAGTASWTAGNVICLSCHGAHYADSSSTTYDGAPQAGNGLLLRRANNDESCLGCHPSTLMHNYTNTQSTRPAWGTTFTCRTCHDPHQGTNLELVKRQIATPSSGTATVDYRSRAAGLDTYGLANSVTPGTGPCEACHTDTRNGNQVTGTTSSFTAGNTSVTLSSTAGLAANWEIKLTAAPPTAWTKIATVVSGTSVTLAVGYKGATGTGAWQGANPRYRATGSGRGAGGTEHFTSACGGCHSHADGFKAAESKGNTACGSCHKFNMIAGGANAEATRTNAYHHVMEIDAVIATTTSYPTAAAPTLSATDNDKSCPQCHADHNLFRPDINTAAGVTRGNNLRTAIGTPPPSFPTGTNPNTTPAAGNFTNVDATTVSPTGGICISCHTNAQTKNQTDQKSDATTAAYAINSTSFAASAHNYLVGGAISNGAAAFNVNCTKCHNSDPTTTSYQGGAATPDKRFMLHASVDRRLRGPLGQTAQIDDDAEDFCYRCHSNAADAIGGTKKTVDANDWYGVITTMSGGSTGIWAAFQKAGGLPTYSTLYLRNVATVNNPQPASKPTAFILTGTYSGTTSFSQLDMAVTSGTTATTKSQTLVSTSPSYYRFWQFTSPPLAGSVTIPSGSTFTVKTRGMCPSGSTCNERFQIWKRSGTTNTALRAAGVFQSGTALPTTLTNQSNAFVTDTAVTMAANDYLVLEIEVVKTGTGTGTMQESVGNYATDAASVALPVPMPFNAGTSGSGHLVGSYTAIHKPNPAEENGAYIGANKHVECEDCHSPHAAKAGLHTQGSNVAGAVLTGAPGFQPTFATTNWPTATAVTYTATTVGATTPEAYVCFKCHSSYNTAIPNNPATAASAPWNVGGGGFTNVALEFSPTNKSGHPVLASLNNYTNSLTPKPLQTTDMVAPWTAVGTQTMTCTDCHGADAAAPASQGPHGSANRMMLKGTNSANWPAVTITNKATAWCANCHTIRATGELHAANHTGFNCYECHIVVPHGGKMSRLLGSGAAGTGMPARYAYQGNIANTHLWAHTKQAASSAWTTTSICQTGCATGTHDTGGQTDTWPP